MRILNFIFLLESVISIPMNTEMRNPQYSGNGETPLYWRTQAKENMQKILNQQPKIGVAKNVIFFLGDGMGISTVTAARILQGQLRNETGEENILSWEKFPYVALSKTYNQDHQTADSAGTATAFLCGVKANYGTTGVDASVQRYDCEGSKGKEVSSILQWSLDKGKSVGFITTTRVTHATPASGYAHSADRNWESDDDMNNVTGGCKDIARQLIEDNPDIQVIMGGGRREFLPYDGIDPEGYNVTSIGRRDNRSLIQDWIDDKIERNKKHRYVWNATDFHSVDPANADYLLAFQNQWIPSLLSDEELISEVCAYTAQVNSAGLFEGSNMNYELDRDKDKGGEPSIAEMTEKAIQILRKNKNGYFLLVEGGRIDHGHHDGWTKRSLVDTLAFDDAVAKADEMTNKEDTLMVVTADHSHVFVISGYPTRGNPIFGLADLDGKAEIADDGFPYTTLMYANGPGGPINTIRDNLTDVNTEDDEYVFQSAVPLDSETHAGEDVAIYARGPMAHLFQGVQEQNYIAHVMAYASCVGDYKNNADCAASLIPKQQICSTNSGNIIGLSLYFTYLYFAGFIIFNL